MVFSILSSCSLLGVVPASPTGLGAVRDGSEKSLGDLHCRRKWWSNGSLVRGSRIVHLGELDRNRGDVDSAWDTQCPMQGLKPNVTHD